MNRVLLGALAGLAATGPMTLAMKLMHEQLPREEQYPLPPRQVTEGLAEKAGLGEHLDEDDREKATWVSHFVYGAACGAGADDPRDEADARATAARGAVPSAAAAGDGRAGGE